MSRRRWLAYLLLNVLVSALVTVTLLYFYDRTLRARAWPAYPTPIPSLTLLPAAALPPNALQGVVVGAGDLANEMVVLRYNGPLALDLTAWRLKDEQGHIYVFPPFTLVSGGAVQLHSGSGVDTPVELYWGLSQPVWQSGETVTLLDNTNTPRLIFTIP